ncbi:hypothetical protein J2T58_001644 [Methanocalculus alkaliphilus]|uniref:hypothetical protein n=1 Tax=Methanocalculus alkaliphilus TaxID=768730 RepID=UPI0020A16983|nr:hypothetical protein [Methanocalculus alkaliphilus]MCP1715775.1 hypothetical protein [Methanocalculus alkaliphilus]
MRIAFYVESQGAGGRRDGALLRVKAPEPAAIRSISGISASRLRPGAAPSQGGLCHRVPVLYMPGLVRVVGVIR